MSDLIPESFNNTAPQSGDVIPASHSDLLQQEAVQLQELAPYAIGDDWNQVLKDVQKFGTLDSRLGKDGAAKLQNSLYYANVMKVPVTWVWDNYDSAQMMYRGKVYGAVDDGLHIQTELNRSIVDMQIGNAYEDLRQLENTKQLGNKYLSQIDPLEKEQLLETERKMGYSGTDVTEPGNKEINKKIAEKLLQIEDLKKQLPNPDPNPEKRGLGTNILTSVASILPQLANSAVWGLVGFATGGALGAIGGLARGGVVAAGRLGMTAAVFSNTTRSESGQMYGDLITEGVSHDIASTAAITVGVINGALETAQFKLLLGGGSAVTKLFRGIVKQGLRQSIIKGTLGAAAVRFAQEYIGNITTETAQEVAQEFVSVVGQEIAIAANNQLEGTNLPSKWNEAFPRIMNTLEQSVMAFAAIGLPGSIISSFKGSKANISQSADPAVISKLVANRLSPEIVKDFELKQTEPETATKVVDEAGSPKVYYHAEAGPVGITLYENPNHAAIRAGDPIVSPQVMVEAIRQKEGDQVSEYAQSVLNGTREQSNLPEAVKSKVNTLVQFAKEQPKTIDVKTAETLKDYIKSGSNGIVSSYVDAQNVARVSEAELANTDLSQYDAVEVTGNNPRVIVQDASKLVPIDSLETNGLPKIGGAVVTNDTGNALEIIDPETLEPVERVPYVMNGDTAVITDLPDSPLRAQQAIETLQSLGTPYTLDISPAKRDELLSQAPGRNDVITEIVKTDDVANRAFSELETRLNEAKNDAERSEILQSYEDLAGQIEGRRQELSRQLDEFDRDYLGEQRLNPNYEPTTSKRELAYQSLQEKLKILSVYDDATIDASIQIMEVRARVMGMDLSTWSDTYISDIRYLDEQGPRGSVTFLEDGKAIISLGKDADATTVVHELGHVIRRQLDDTDQATLLGVYKSTEWNKEAEEKFARDFEAWFARGEKAPKGLLEVFHRIAILMRDLVGYFFNSLNPKVDEVISKSFQAHEYVPPVEQPGESILYQPSKDDPAYSHPLFKQLSEVMAAYETASAQDKPVLLEQARLIQAQLDNEGVRELEEIKGMISRGEDVPTELLEKYSSDPVVNAEIERLAQLDNSMIESDETIGLEPDKALPTTRDEANQAFAQDLDKTLDHIKETFKNISSQFTDKLFWKEARKASDEFAIRPPEYIKFDLPVGEELKNFIENDGVNPKTGQTFREEARESVLKRINWYRWNFAYLLQDGDLLSSYQKIDETNPDSIATGDIETRTESDLVRGMELSQRLEYLRERLKGPLSNSTSLEIDQLTVELRDQMKIATNQAYAQEEAYKELDDRLTFSMNKASELQREVTRLEKVEDKSTEQKTRLTQAEKELKSARREVNSLIKQTDKKDESITELRARVKEVKTANREALDSARKEATLTMSRYREAQRVRAYKTGLINRALKPVPGSVDFRYGEQIETLQSLIDPFIRNVKHETVARKLKEFRDANPDFYKLLPLYIQNIEYAERPEAFTIAELEALNKEIEELKSQGKAVRDKKLEDEKTAIRMSTDKLTRELINKAPDALEKTSFIRAKGKAGDAILDLVEPQYLFDTLDGKQDFQGDFVKEIHDPMSKSYGDAARNTIERLTDLKNKMKELKLKRIDAFEHLSDEQGPIKINQKGKPMPVRNQDAMGIYMLMQNEESKQAVLYGNMIAQSDITRIVKALPQAWKDLGDWIIEHGYGDHYQRLAEIYSDLNNQRMGQVDRYSPMARLGKMGEQLETDLKDEILVRNGLKKRPGDGFTKERVKIGKKNQTPVRLDALNLFEGMIERQEMYINMAPVAKKIDRIFSGRGEYSQALITGISNVYGDSYVKYIREWLGRSVNPPAPRSDFERGVLKARSNMSVAFLGLRLSSVLKQAGGFFLTLADAPIATFTNFIKATSGMFYFPTYVKMEKRMMKFSPEMQSRVIDSSITVSSTAESKAGYVFSKGKEFTLKPLALIDRFTVTVSWNAVFDSFKSRNYSDEHAALEATNAINRTQPTSNPLESSPLMARRDLAAVLTAFGSAMSKIFNSLIHLPNWKSGRSVSRYALTVVGTALSAAVFTLVSHRGPPPDAEEEPDKAYQWWVDFFSGTSIGNSPIVGSAVQATLKGYDPEFPLVSSLFGVFKVVPELVKNGELTEAQGNRMITDAFETASVVFGLPFLAGKTGAQAIEDPDNALEYLLLGGKIDDNQN